VSRLPNGTVRRTQPSASLESAPVVQSAPTAQSGPSTLQSISGAAPNNDLEFEPEETLANPPQELGRVLPGPDPDEEPIPRPNRNTGRRKNQPKAAIKVASINIRGYGSHNASSPQNKWFHVNQVMREKKIAILMVQETHMDNERQDQVDHVFSKRLKIHSSANPENPTGRGGVAVVLNKGLVNANDSKATVIVPGRAILIQTKWHQDEKLTVLAVYAPNEAGENRLFWKRLADYYKNNARAAKPDILAGDFNMVEDPIDRLPMHDDKADTVEALDELKLILGLQDGWRSTFPATKAFTYLQSNGTRSQSRIDRIYSTARTFESAREWIISPSGIPNADHRMISVRIFNEASPMMGKGRWSIPKRLLSDKILNEFIMESGIEAKKKLDRLNGARSEDQNPQKILAAFKWGIMGAARKRDRAIVPKILQELRKNEEELERINNDGNTPECEKILESSKVTQKITELERKRHLKRRVDVAVRNRIEGETISRYWTQTNKEIKPRDVFHALRKPQANETENPYENSSDKMAELARDYHENLQRDGALDNNPLAREESFRGPLKSIAARATLVQRDTLKARVSKDEVEAALKASSNDKAAGLDGVTYELWKLIHSSCQKAAKENKPSFDVLELMVAAFNDIEANGVDNSTRLAEGWMCPIYKKNDKNEISNYRPITILNTDYKIFTKILATRLAQVAPSLLHKNQAGFVPGRKIADQTKLVELMIAYAEATEENGLIVALDQEKAYDKIAHDYLWRALETFRIPQELIRTIRALYERAETQVMINGYLSSGFKVVRGVRQGDPMSCLLFDLAIEPLAAMLRQSALKGYQIPGSGEKLITNLFADDTTTFLSEGDKFEDLQVVLDTWCQASTAKFNIAKTEIIPIGSSEFRQKVVETRKANESHEKIPENMNIVKDGEAIRVLGAWVGNKIDNEGVWAPTLEKIDRNLEQWEKGHPTMEGRRLIVQMVVGGMTQYLTQVQGMPQVIEKRVAKRIRKFMWNEKQMSPVNEATLYAPIEVGGRAVLDIKSRNEAISVMWLKSYLSFGPSRPTWALVADALMAAKVPVSERNVEVGMRKNIFLQSWKTYSGSRAPKCLQNLLQTSKKFGVRPEGLLFSREILKLMPIWLHREADKRLRRVNCQDASKCLRTKHMVETVGDAEDVAGSLDNPDHVGDVNCLCESCIVAGDEKGCENPHACFERAKRLLDAIPPKWNPKTGWVDEGRPLSSIERGMITAGELQDIFRIFTEGQTTNLLPQRSAGPENGAQSIETVATGAESTLDDAGNKSLGAGVFFDSNDPRNRDVRLPSTTAQAMSSCDLLAVKLAAESSSIDKRVHIHCKLRSTEVLLVKKLKKMEETGYIGVENPELVQATVAAIRKRGNKSMIKYHSNRSDYPKIAKAAECAKRGAHKQNPDGVDLEIPPTLKAEANRCKVEQDDSVGRL
jgi:exonuclease III